MSGSGASVIWGASIWELTAASAVQDFAVNWETSPTNPSYGFGGLVVDGSDNLFFADSIGHRIVKFSPSGVMSVFAGSGQAGSANGVGTVATFQGPNDVAIDGAGNLFVPDGGTVRKIAPDGTVSTVATNVWGNAIAVDAKGNIFVPGVGSIQRIDANGNLSTFPLDVGSNFMSSLAVDSSGALYVDTRGVGAQILKITFN
jgi:sugar lactone lactonase YvrE